MLLIAAVASCSSSNSGGSLRRDAQVSTEAGLDGANPDGATQPDAGNPDAAVQPDATQPDGESPDGAAQPDGGNTDGAAQPDASGGDAAPPRDGGSDSTAGDAAPDSGPAPGTLDTTFGDAGVALAGFGVTGDRAQAEVLQPDGKILLAGRAINEAASSAAMVRYNTDGSLDTSFGTGGILMLPSYAALTALAVQPDGKIVTLTSDDYILRLDANGVLDTGFGTNGAVNVVADAIVVQPDGKIVVAGGKSGKMFVARLDSKGALDPGFGTNGETSFAVSSAVGASATASALALETSGTTTTSIVVAGDNVQSNDSYFAVARLSGADGSLDTTFNGVGYVTTAVGQNSFNPTTTANVLVQPDGKIVLGGTCTLFTAYGDYAAYAVLRYTTAGVLDTTFNGNGIATVNPMQSQDDFLTGIALQGTSIVGVGNQHIRDDRGMYFFRLNADGSPDTKISATGLTEFPGPGSGPKRSAAYGVQVQPDGKIVVAGSNFTRSVPYEARNEDFAVLRLDAASASPDTSFDSDGWATTNIAGGDDGIRAVAVQPDGKIVGAGYTFNGADDDFLIVRFMPDGSLDPTFGDNGVAIAFDSSGESERANAVAIQPDGKIVVAGFVDRGGTQGMEVARLDADGSADTTFSSTGERLEGAGDAYGLAIQSDGKILLGGADTNYFVVDRLLADGTPDTLPGDAGTFPISTNGDSSPSGGRALALLGGGKFVLAGYSGSELGLVRYNPDSSLDSTFDNDGKVSLNLFSPAGAVGLALQTTGKLVVAGDEKPGTTNDFALARLDASGALDTSFAGGGEVTTDLGSNASLTALLAQPDDWLVCVGSTSATPASLTAVRYTANGAVDTTFGTNGVVTVKLAEQGAHADAVARQSDGMLLIGGAAFDGWQRDAVLVRVSP